MLLKKAGIKLAVALVILLTGSALLSITLAPPPTREDVSQTWVAFSTEDTYSMRLTLNQDGTGSGVLLPCYGSPEPFEITSWTLEDYSVSLSLHFRNSDLKSTKLRGLFKRRLFSYTSGMLPHPERLTADWLPGPFELSLDRGKERIRFGVWPERELQEILKRLKSAM